MSWTEASAEAIAALHSEAFAPSLIAAIRKVVSFEHSVIFAYCGDRRPIALHSDFPSWKRKVMVEDYQAGPYLLDPFYLHRAAGAAPRLMRLRDLAPDRFYQGEYFRNYYMQTELAEEIGFMLQVGRDVHVVISAMRARRVFSARDIRALGVVVPVVEALAAHHWADLTIHFGEPATRTDGQRLSDLIDTAFRSLGGNLLTAREIEVAEYTLKGYSAEATGLALGIALGTVRIHRRNIYVKLRIGSQGELFSKFIAALKNADCQDQVA